MSLCGNCGAQCVGGDAVACGLCLHNFHIKCVKLNSACLKLLKSNKNLLFKCDTCCSVYNSSCLAKFENAFRALKEFQDDLCGEKITLNNENASSSNQVGIIAASNNNNASNSDASNKRILRSKANSNKVADLVGLTVGTSSSASSSAESANGVVAELATELNANFSAVSDADHNNCASPAIQRSIGEESGSNVIAQTAVSGSLNLPAVSSVVVSDNLSASGNANAVLSQQQVNNESECEDNTVWTKVNNKRRNNNVVVVGSNVSTELCVADRMKWAHLSSFDPKVTADDIINYVCKHVKIERKAISCYALIKKDDPAENRTHVNFRLGVLSAEFPSILDAKIWPLNVKVKPFNFFRKRGGRTQRS
ncbi:uncharacterized protein LOC118735261 [Rhagoletis pomonella]|uniref:uncharacterized protein LOC118735261 n=1 Tax=Rhagoletis pomonella TaxID=28610 RepID=UPI0017806F53|nr:uncharacterized protein LOC118735261 [Rhagoletis pomonella]